jgi:hypothetical protein
LFSSAIIFGAGQTVGSVAAMSVMYATKSSIYCLATIFGHFPVTALCASSVVCLLTHELYLQSYNPSRN